MFALIVLTKMSYFTLTLYTWSWFVGSTSDIFWLLNVGRPALPLFKLHSLSEFLCIWVLPQCEQDCHNMAVWHSYEVLFWWYPTIEDSEVTWCLVLSLQFVIHKLKISQRRLTRLMWQKNRIKVSWCSCRKWQVKMALLIQWCGSLVNLVKMVCSVMHEILGLAQLARNLGLVGPAIG